MVYLFKTEIVQPALMNNDCTVNVDSCGENVLWICVLFLFVCLSPLLLPMTRHEETQKSLARQIKNFLEHRSFRNFSHLSLGTLSFATAWSNAKYDVVLCLCSALLRLKMKELLMPSTCFILKYASMSGVFFWGGGFCHSKIDDPVTSL